VAYQVEFDRPSLRQFDALPKQLQKRIGPRIDALGQNPRPPGAVKLRGAENLYRTRMGNYRIVYQVLDDQRRVIVTAVAHRGSVYRRR
jgi:mRNA interferase RelE/StbE